MPKAPATKTRKAASSDKEGGRAKRGGTKKGKGGPKRALSAYMFFSQDWRERIKAENPEAGFGEIGKLLGAKWKEMGEVDKEPYERKAKEDKVRAEEEKEAAQAVKDRAGSDHADGDDGSADE